MSKPGYQEALFIIELRPKRKHSQKQKRLTSEIIVNSLQNVSDNKKSLIF